MAEKVLCIAEHELTNLFEKVNAHLKIDKPMFVKGVTAELWTNLSVPFEFVSRDECEQDDSFKQMIPYVIVRHGIKYLAYSRTKQSGEKRLVGLKSIGIGGHINQSDLPEGDHQLNAIIRNCIVREVQEELGVFLSREQYTVRGLLYLPVDDVSRKHFGIVALADIDPDAIVQPENTMTHLTWESPLDIFRNRNGYETWSKYLIEYLMTNKEL